MLSENESWVVIANISNRIRRSQNNTTNESIDKEAYNRQLDDWFYRRGITIIPQDTSINTPPIKWSEFQNRRPSDNEYEAWKKNGLFDKGAAAMLGRVWGMKQTTDLDKPIQYYLWVIDVDSKEALDEIGKLDNIKERCIIEYHEDNMGRLHIFGLSTHQIPSKSLTDGKVKMEVFAASKHLMNVSPSIHKNGFPYIRPDNCTSILSVEDNIDKYIDSIFKKHGQDYLKGNRHRSTSNGNSTANDDPFKFEEEHVYEGSRDNTLRDKIIFLLFHHRGKIPIEDIKQLAYSYNQRVLEPPLPDSEVESTWKSCLKHVIKKVKDTPPTLEAELTEKYKFKSLTDTEEIYYWNKDKGIFMKNAEWLIKKECMKSNPEMKSRDVKEVVDHITWSNYIDRKELDCQIEWMATDNCMVNLRTLEIKEHSPDYLATVQIPHNFNSVSETYEPLIGANGKMLKEAHSVEEWEQLCKCPCPCPEIMKFFYEVISPEDVETILDFMAYCLWRGLPFHKYLLFNGGGRNGKGVTIHLFKKLLGWRNISGESLKRILETRFASAKLYGKMANIDADISKEELKHTGTLKTLTGEDLVSAEFKFKDPFDFENYAKLVFSANAIPMTPDETDAFFARLIIINFPNQYVGDKADPWLKTKLTTEEEMSGLLSLVVARLPRVLAKGIYTLHSSIEENYQKYMLSSNPIRAFYELTIRKETGNNESKQSVFDSYTKFCEDKKLAKESIDTFNRRLKADWGLLDSKIQKDGVRVPHWLDIKRIDYMEAEEGQEQLV